MFTARNADKSVFANRASSNCLWRSEFESFEFWPRSWAMLTGAAPLAEGTGGALTWFPPKSFKFWPRSWATLTGVAPLDEGAGGALTWFPPKSFKFWPRSWAMLTGVAPLDAGAGSAGGAVTWFPPKLPNGSANELAIGAGALGVGIGKLWSWALPPAFAD